MSPPVNASVQAGSLMKSDLSVRRKMMHSGTRCGACVSAGLWLQEEPIFNMANLATVTIQYLTSFPFVISTIYNADISPKKSNSQEKFAKQFNLFQYWLIPVSENSNLNTSIMRTFKWKTNPLVKLFKIRNF